MALAGEPGERVVSPALSRRLSDGPDGRCWSVGSGQGCKPGVPADHEVGPWPSLGESQDPSSAGGDDAAGHGQESKPESFGFPDACFVLVPGQDLGPGQQLVGELGDLEPDLVFGEGLERQV